MGVSNDALKWRIESAGVTIPLKKQEKLVFNWLLKRLDRDWLCPDLMITGELQDNKLLSDSWPTLSCFLTHKLGSVTRYCLVYWFEYEFYIMVGFCFTRIVHALNSIRALCEITFNCFQCIEDITMMTGVLKLYVAMLISVAALLFRMVDGVGGLMYVEGPVNLSQCCQTERHDTNTKERHSLNQASWKCRQNMTVVTDSVVLLWNTVQNVAAYWGNLLASLVSISSPNVPGSRISDIICSVSELNEYLAEMHKCINIADCIGERKDFAVFCWARWGYCSHCAIRRQLPPRFCVHGLSGHGLMVRCAMGDSYTQ